MTSHFPACLRGCITVPGDKSIGHRLVFLSAIAQGNSKIVGFPPGNDCQRTLQLVQMLGINAQFNNETLEIEGAGLAGLKNPKTQINAGNSGTTARLACGVLCAQNFTSNILGDKSLSKRPFNRVVNPLSQMGASFKTTQGRLPITIYGGQKLHGIDYTLPVPSAQVKTAVLLAGLFAEGTTSVREKIRSRDHTEIALTNFGADITVEENTVKLSPGKQLFSGQWEVPGDFSSAAFFIAAAACIPRSDLLVKAVNLNPTRTGLLNILKKMGANIQVEPKSHTTNGELSGNIRVLGSQLRGTDVSETSLVSMIDEVPILALVATQAEGVTTIQGASELRVKESNRLASIIDGLRALGAEVDEIEDGFTVRGGKKLRPASLKTHGDHRMIMTWAIASLLVEGDCSVDHIENVNISYPDFHKTLQDIVS